MPPDNQKQHIRFEGFSNSFDYKYPRDPFGVTFTVKDRNRNAHGSNILQQLEAIKQNFDLPNEVELPQGIIRDDALYVEFISEWGYELKFESLEQTKGEFQILGISPETGLIDDETKFRYRVTLMMTEGGVSDFIKKVEKYLNPAKNTKSGNPANSPLINNLSIIQLATLKSFWSDAPEIPFPNENENVWWEVWFRRTDNDEVKIQNVLENLRIARVEVSMYELKFAEHIVRLVKGTSSQLSNSLLLLDNLAELRKPQETADFISHKSDGYSEQREWIDDLLARTEAAVDSNSVLICLLDSGVNNSHPLIAPFLPDERLYSYNPDWGRNDSWPNEGHGTGAAGLALYGDMVDALSSIDNIRILHGIESFKIIHTNDPNDPKLYGAITEFATSSPLVDRQNPRVFCMTITDKQFAFEGRPSAWSAAVDKIAFGSALEPVVPQLFIVSGGNVQITNHLDFPSKNYIESIHDPGQAYNAVTVGTYTRKDRIDPQTGLSHLAQYGAMAPTNSTSTFWQSQWPLKPDIVMEGGNSSTDGISVSDHHSLKLLSTDKEHNRFLFAPFGDTSAAAALAAKFAAELRISYPNYWPETIRALMVHSATWTEAMLNNQAINNLFERDKINLLRSVGYGVPVKEKALFSANNSLTLIAERTIQPYKMEGSKINYNEYHLYELPWPVETLREQLFDQNVTLKITLSYFIEPNPGNRRYANNFQYHSHVLDFAVIKPNEGLPVFKRRISGASELPEDERDSRGESWFIGNRVRSKGSVKKDFITMSGADMAQRNYIAIYPKNGWYKTRKKLGKTNSIVRYSLIINIETANVEIDLYTPVYNQIENIIPV